MVAMWPSVWPSAWVPLCVAHFVARFVGESGRGGLEITKLAFLSGSKPPSRTSRLQTGFGSRELEKGHDVNAHQSRRELAGNLYRVPYVALETVVVREWSMDVVTSVFPEGASGMAHRVKFVSSEQCADEGGSGS
jgi:hypothetical protein